MKFAYFNKTYEGDLEFTISLYNSFKRHYKGNSPFYIIIPEKDKNKFLEHFPQKIIFTDEMIISKTRINIEDFEKLEGWKSQQIIKLSIPYFFDVENYIAIDSDCYINKDFSDEIFFTKNGHCKTISFKHKNGKKDKKIIDEIGFKPNNKNYFVTSQQLFNSLVIFELEKFITQIGFKNFIDMINYHPFEAFWYGNYIHTYRKDLFFKTPPFFFNIFGMQGGIAKSSSLIFLEACNKSRLTNKIGFYIQYPNASIRINKPTFDEIKQENKSNPFIFAKHIINFISIFVIIKKLRYKIKNKLADFYVKKIL